MVTTHDLIWGVVLPAVWTVVIMLLASLPWRRGRKREVAPWGPAVALAGGFALAYTGIAGTPALRPVEAEGWLVHMAVIAAAVTVITAAISSISPRISKAVGFESIVVLAGTAWLIVGPLVQRGDAKLYWSWVAGVAIAMIVWWLLMEMLARRAPGLTVPAILVIFAISAAMVLMNGHTQRFAQLAGAVAVMLAAMLAIAWLVQINLSRGGILAIALILLGLIVGGHLYADVTFRDMYVLAIAPLGAWAAMLPGVRRKPWLAVTVAIVAVLIVLSIVLVPAIRGLHETYREQMESTYY